MPRGSLNKSLDRALDLLELLCARETPLRSIDIARALDVAPNTTNNTLRVLFRRGYVAQDEGGRYYPGHQCHGLANRPSLFRLLQAVAEPCMSRFSQTTGGNAFLGVEQCGKLYMVVRTEGDGAVRATHEQLWRDKFHATAVGKIIVAERGLDWFRRIVAGRRLTRFTPHTVTRLRTLEQDVAAIRQRGYAIADRESHEELYAIGVPVRDRRGNFLAGLGQSIPHWYVATGRVDIASRLDALVRTAQQIGTEFSTAEGTPHGAGP